jgi:tetratricopeptide (TPR) repeat protein
MISLDSSPIAWLNRPYFDLGPSNSASMHLSGIEISYYSLVDNVFYVGLQATLPASFRKRLLQETGMTEYQIDNPSQLPIELRTERWQKLCDYLSHYQELEPVTQLQVLDLLKRLCLYQVILEYVPEMSDLEIANSPVIANLAYRRVLSMMMLGFESGTFDYLDEFERIANYAPSGSLAKINAILQLIVQYAKDLNNLKKTEFLLEMAAQEVQNAKPLVSNFIYNLLMSIYYRAIALVAVRRGNKDQVTRYMDESEFYAANLTGDDEWQQIVIEENRNIILESRTKEALWLRDLDLAHERSQQLVQRDPFDPKYYVELGEILIKQGKFEDAAKTYRSAIRLGPPYTSIALYMAGQCYQALGELDMACDFYLASLKLDPVAICAVERLADLAPRLGNVSLANWSQLRLTELQAQQQRRSVKNTSIKKLSYA